MEHGPKTILLIEDDGIIAISTRRLLEEHGYAVLHAFDGEKALARVSEAAGAVDLILMDIDLGRGMDGTETARAVLREYDIPVVFVSSHTEKDIVQRTEEISSYGYVVKNSGEMVLLASVKMAIRLHTAHRENLLQSRELAQANEQLQTLIVSTEEANTELQSTQELILERETQLRDSNERMRAIVEHSPLGSHSYRLEKDGRLIFLGANPASDRMLGIETNALIGKTVEEAFPGLRGTEVPDAYRATAATGLPFTREDVRYEANGIRGTFELQGFQTGPGQMTVFFKEVTAQRQAEAAIREREEDFRQLFSSALDAKLLTSTDGRILAANPAACELLRGSEEEICRAGRAGLVDETDPRLKKWLEEREVSGKAHGLHRMRRLDGSLFEAEVSSSIFKNSHNSHRAVHTSMTIRDVTARNRAETALRESEGNYRSLVESAVDGIMIHQNGRAVYANPSAVRMIGAERPEQVLGKPAIEFLHPDCRASALERIRNVIEHGAPAPPLEEKIVRLDGSTLNVELVGAACMLNGMPAVQVVCRDITERILAKAELEKLAARNELLLKELQHRVKNTLNIMASLLNLEMRRLPDGQSRQVLQNAGERIRAMAMIYEQLYQTGSLEGMDMRLYLERLCRTLFTAYANDPDRVQLDTDLGPVTLDLKRALPIGLIVNELITNALKYAYPAGQAGRVRLRLETAGKEGILSIVDDGVGLPHGFDFEKATTMGMSLVRILAEQIGGSITVHNGRGTSAELRFALEGA